MENLICEVLGIDCININENKFIGDYEFYKKVCSIDEIIVDFVSLHNDHIIIDFVGYFDELNNQ